MPYVPRGDVSIFERMRTSGHENDFYMFEQIRPEADRIWADASITIPGILYWASGFRTARQGLESDGSDPQSSSSGAWPVTVMG